MSEPVDSERVPRPAIFTLLAVLQFLFGAGLFAACAYAAYHTASAYSGRRPVLIGVILITSTLVAGVLHVVCGIGLWKLRTYGWSLLRVWSWLILLILPIGTIIGILLLMYLNSQGVRLLYSEQPLGILTPAERRELTATTQSMVPILTGAGLLVVLGLFVAVAAVVSRFLPPGSQFVAPPIEPRAMIIVERFGHAQTLYAAGNGGRFGTPECLASPPRCVPGFAGTTVFDGPPQMAFEKDGYVFQFFSPETLAGKRDGDGQAPLRLERYALLALPVSRRRHDSRMLCVDGSRKIRASGARQRPPSVLPGVCPAEWAVILTLPPS